MPEKLTQTQQEQAVNQIIIEKQPSKLDLVISRLKEIGNSKIELKVPKKVQALALSGLVGAGTFGAVAFGNPSSAFAENRGSKLELAESVESFDLNSLTPSARDKLIKLRVSNPTLNKQISDATIKSQSSIVPKDLIPKSVLETQETSDNIKKIEAETEAIKANTAQINQETEAIKAKKATETQRQIEQPSAPSQPTQPPKQDSGFPILEIAIGAAIIGGSAAFGLKKLAESNSSQPKKKSFKGKRNEQYGMSNTTPDGVNQMDLADRVAKQKLKLQQAEQLELMDLQELRILEDALELAVNEGTSTNSIAYKNAKREIVIKKAEFDKKYLS